MIIEDFLWDENVGVDPFEGENSRLKFFEDRFERAYDAHMKGEDIDEEYEFDTYYLE